MRTKLSIKSSAPPIPGMVWPESLEAACLLNTDSMRSDGILTMAIGRAKIAERSGLMNSNPAILTVQAKSAEAAAEKTNPPMQPSQDFAGLMEGAILCFPNKVPMTSPPTSVNFVAMTTQMTQDRPMCLVLSPVPIFNFAMNAKKDSINGI